MSDSDDQKEKTVEEMVEEMQEENRPRHEDTGPESDEIEDLDGATADEHYEAIRRFK